MNLELDLKEFDNTQLVCLLLNAESTLARMDVMNFDWIDDSTKEYMCTRAFHIKIEVQKELAARKAIPSSYAKQLMDEYNQRKAKKQGVYPSPAPVSPIPNNINL